MNQFEITEKSSEADISALYLISKEVAIEITNYAEEFLADKRINKEMIKNELEMIEKRTDLFVETERKECLYQFLKDAEEKIELIKEKEEMDSKKEGV